MSTVVYPLDLTGIASTNLVKNDLYSVSESKFRDYNLIIPRFAPFYTDNFKATLSVNGITRDLVEDVDYSFALNYIAGVRTTGKAMYGGITLHNLELNGIVNLTYQTIGGEHVTDRLEVLNNLVEYAWNPKTVVWDSVTNVPCALPPKPHYQDYDTFYGQGAVIVKLQEIADAIGQNSSLTAELLNEFIQAVGIATLNNYVKRAGDKMEGTFELFRAPLEPMEAVNLKFLEDNFLSLDNFDGDIFNLVTHQQLEALLELKLSLTGGELTGPLILHNDPTRNMQAANKKYVDDQVGEVDSRLGDLKSDVEAIQETYVTKDELNLIMAQVLNRTHSIKQTRSTGLSL